MPVIKNAQMRYFIIDACLSNSKKRYWSIEDILKRLAAADIRAGRRTVESDIESMRHDSRLGYFAPIQYCRKNKGHYYSDQNYSIKGFELTEEDIQGFSMLVDGLQKYKGAAMSWHVEAVLDKLIKLSTKQRKNTRIRIVRRKHLLDDIRKI